MRKGDSNRGGKTEAGKGIKRSRSGILRTGGHVEGLEAIMIRDDERICERWQRGDRREREGCALKRRQLPRLSFREMQIARPLTPRQHQLFCETEKKSILKIFEAKQFN